MNSLSVGLNTEIVPPSGGFLMLWDDVPDVPRVKIFDPKEHSFNPLYKLDYRKSRECVDIVYTVYGQGENTLTVRNGKRALMQMLMEKPKRLDELPEPDKKDLAGIEAKATVDDLLLSPLLSKVFCEPTNFAFKKTSRIVARINRAELGDFDATVLGLFLISQFQGQVILSDGFYLRDSHVRLVREERLICRVSTLSELPPKVREQLMLCDRKHASRATAEDAEELARYDCPFPPATNEYKSFVAKAME